MNRRPTATAVGLALALSLGVAGAAERAIDKEVVVNATLDKPGTPGPRAKAS